MSNFDTDPKMPPVTYGQFSATFEVPQGPSPSHSLPGATLPGSQGGRPPFSAPWTWRGHSSCVSRRRQSPQSWPASQWPQASMAAVVPKSWANAATASGRRSDARARLIGMLAGWWQSSLSASCLAPLSAPQEEKSRRKSSQA